MKYIMQRICQGTLSVITTFVLMAAPVAAIVYFSEPIKPSDSSLMNANYMNPWHVVSKTDHKAGVIKESFATEPIITLVKKLDD